MSLIYVSWLAGTTLNKLTEKSEALLSHAAFGWRKTKMQIYKPKETRKNHVPASFNSEKALNKFKSFDGWIRLEASAVRNQFSGLCKYQQAYVNLALEFTTEMSQV